MNRNKVKDNTGKTILMALLFLLVGMMISVVVLSATITATQTVRQHRLYQQSNLTVSSAAQLLQEGIGADSYRKTKTVVSYNNGNPGTTTPGEIKANGIVERFLNSGLESLESEPARTSYKKTFYLSVEGMNDVTVEAEMIREETTDSETGYRYDIVMDVFMTNNNDNNYYMTVKATGRVDREYTKNTEGNKTTEITTVTFDWPAPAIQKGSAAK